MLETGKPRIAVIGAGPAGISAVQAAASLGAQIDWYDKSTHPGGKLNDYFQLFPDRITAREILEGFHLPNVSEAVSTHFGQVVDQIKNSEGRIVLQSDNQQIGEADAVIVATGFDFFDARLKEEFGYGMYDQVITSTDLEKIFKTHPDDFKIDGHAPSSVAFVHCVGSRDQQAGINYCSRLCCITGIKQAIEIKEMFPSCKVTNFYIDIRAFGSGYEELYREAQEKFRIQFIRGRVSEASENQQKKIVLKAEDTLMGRPLKLTVDWLVLLIGMVPSCTQVQVDAGACIHPETGFYLHPNSFSGSQLADQNGVFTAGACSGPVSIPEAISSGRSAAFEALEYLKRRS